MAKIRNVSGENLLVPALGGRLVLEEAVVEVEDADVYGFTCQEPNWAPADDAAATAHAAAVAAENPLDLSRSTKPQLVEYAAENGIDISGLKTKADILAAITATEVPNDPAAGGQED